jgi:hypothetical protein
MPINNWLIEIATGRFLQGGYFDVQPPTIDGPNDPVTGLPKMPAYDKSLNYMDEYWNIYLQNQALLSQIDKVANDRNDLLTKTFKIESFYD